MMKVLIPLLLLTSLISFPVPGDSDVTTLEKKLLQARGDERYAVLMDLAQATKSNDLRRAAQYAREAVDIADRDGTPVRRVDAQRLLGVMQSGLCDYPSALKSFQASLEGAQALDDRQRIAEAMNNLGILHMVLGEYQEALDFATRTLEILKEIGKPEKIAAGYSNIGNIYVAMGEDAAALDFYAEGLVLDKKVGTEAQVANTYNNIGLARIHLGQFDEAEKTVKEALQIFERLGDKPGVAFSLSHLGMIAATRERNVEALSHYERALALREALGDRRGVAFGLQCTGQILARMGDPKRAIEEDFKPAVAIARELGIRKLEGDILYSLSQTYEQAGDITQAFGYYKQAASVNDTLRDARAMEQLSILRARFEVEKKDQEIALLRQSQRVQRLIRNTLFAGAFVLVVLALMLWRGARLKERANREMRRANTALKMAQEEKEKATRAELARVARVTLLGQFATAFAHELKQPLTAIRANAQAARRMLASGRYESAEYDEILADIAGGVNRTMDILQGLRRLIQSGEIAKEPLEINEVLRDGLAFSRAVAEEHGVAIEVNLAPGLPPIAGDRLQLQQVLLNLVNNAAEALEGSGTRNPLIQVRTENGEGGTIRVLVRDNGPGLDDKAIPEAFEPFFTTKPDGMGMGLAISKSIVEAHGGALAATRNEEGGLTITVSLPQAAP